MLLLAIVSVLTLGPAFGGVGYLVAGIGGAVLGILIGAAVVTVASDEERRDAHRTIAELSDDPDRRAWHAGAATDGPDDDVAAAIDRERQCDPLRAAGREDQKRSRGQAGSLKS